MDLITKYMPEKHGQDRKLDRNYAFGHERKHGFHGVSRI